MQKDTILDLSKQNDTLLEELSDNRLRLREFKAKNELKQCLEINNNFYDALLELANIYQEENNI